MSQHAYLPPSGADCWSACALWPQMQLDYPDLGDPTRSEEGTLAHDVLKCMMLGEPLPAGHTEEMIDGAMMTLANLPAGVPKWAIEQPLRGRVIHDSQNWGTPDLVGWADMHLHVVDYKFGHGYVEHVENLQCINYALLELARAEIDGLVEQAITVSIHIAQPRAFGREPFRTWTVPATDLRTHANLLRQAATKATRLDRTATTGPQCDHCNGRLHCEALRAVGWRAVDMSSAALPLEVSPVAMGTELEILQAAARRLAARISGIEAQLSHLVKGGHAVPGWGMESGLGIRQWAVEDDAVVAMFGGKTVPLSPTQAEKMGVPKEMVAAFVTRKPTPAKLVKVDDAAARRVFR